MTVLKLNQIRAVLQSSILVISLILPSLGSADPSNVKQDFRIAFQCAENSDCVPDRSNRLISEVVSILQPANHDRETHNLAASQLSCEKAIRSASVSYISRRLDLTERGLPPEKADRKAAKELDRIVKSCNVPVASLNGTTLPQIGSPCATYVGPPGSWVDVYSLHRCLHNTLALYTDYLGY